MKNEILYIYVNQNNTRVGYIFELIFKDILGIAYMLVTSREAYIQYQGPKINYSSERMPGGIFIAACSLLYESRVMQRELTVKQWNGLPIFFHTHNTSDLPFDPFAASFFLVSRYEEYLPCRYDKHGRYLAKQSIAYKNNFIKRPVVDLWALEVKKLLQENYPAIECKENKFQYITTIDVDLPYSHINKSFTRTVASFVKLFFNGKFRSIGSRIKILLGMKKDPFDNYDFIEENQKRFKFPLLYFFLMSKSGKYDNNVSRKNKNFHRLVRSLFKNHIIGIHLSYSSFKTFKRKQAEVSRLERIIKTRILHNRFHFLKFQLPGSYQELIKLGIKHDYTMGYAETHGFRAGTCTPFFFYDLSLEKKTALLVHPFAYMDANFFDYQKMQTGQALEEIKHLIDEAYSVGGRCYSLWHNHVFSDILMWKGWKDVFIQTVKYAMQKQEQ